MNKQSLIRQLNQLHAASALNLDDRLTYFVRLTSARGSVELSRSPPIQVTAEEWRHFLRYKIERMERELGSSDRANAEPAQAPAPTASLPADATE